MTCVGPGLLHCRCGHRSIGEGVLHPYTATGQEHHGPNFSDARQHACSIRCLGRSSVGLHSTGRERAICITGYAGPTTASRTSMCPAVARVRRCAQLRIVPMQVLLRKKNKKSERKSGAVVVPCKQQRYVREPSSPIYTNWNSRSSACAPTCS